MAELQVDVRPSGIESAVVYAPFDESLQTLTANGYEPISFEQNAELRIQQGQEANISKNGNRTRAGFAYAKGELPVFALDSPLLNPELAKQATQANREGRYFVTDRKVYDELREQAEAQKDKEPETISVLLLPSRNNFTISGSNNRNTFRGIFKKQGELYLPFAKQNELTVYLVDKKEVDKSDGALLTQAWFGSLDGRSDVDGYDRYLDYYDRLRGVRTVAPQARAEISPARESELYAPGQISIALQKLELKGLEAQILKELKRK